MIYARVLTRDGVAEFKKYIQDVQELPRKNSPDLNEEPYSEERSIELGVKIETNKHFDTKMEMAEYLNKQFSDAGIERPEIIEQDGLWSWLAYIWFDQLCPIKKGSRSPGQISRYICGKSYSAYSKHLVAFPYYVYSLHERGGSKLFLVHPLDYVGNVTEQIGARKYIMTSDESIKVLHRLYWGDHSEIVDGAASRNSGGTFTRFGKVVEQLKLTYDLHDMYAEKIVEILPSEFDKFIDRAGGPKR